MSEKFMHQSAKIEKPPQNESNTWQEVFKKHFPEGDIKTIELQEIPPKALERIKSYSQKFMDIYDWTGPNFEKLFLVSGGEGIKTYVAVEYKTYGYQNEGIFAKERLFYLADTDDQGELLGHGEVRFAVDESGVKNPIFKNKPFVGFTETPSKIRGQGYGTRRLFLMNALAEMEYNLPLHSDTLVSAPQRSVWLQLIADGKAKRYYEKSAKCDRYAFLKKPKH